MFKNPKFKYTKNLNLIPKLGYIPNPGSNPNPKT